MRHSWAFHKVTGAARAARRPSVGDARCSCRTGDPTAPGWRSTAIRRPLGCCKVSLHSASPDPNWEMLGAELERQFGGASLPSVRASHCTFIIDAQAADAQAWLAEHHPELTLMSAGQSIEIFKEAGPPREFVRALQAERDRGKPCARPHADGHREPRHHRALAPVLDRAGPVPGPQRLAVEPQPPAARAAARGDPLSDRQRLRGRGGLSDLAAARGRVARAGARRLPRRPRRLLHVRGRDRRRVRGAARSDRMQARRDGRDRRVGRDGLGIPRDRGPTGRGGRSHVGAGAGAASTAGALASVA